MRQNHRQCGKEVAALLYAALKNRDKNKIKGRQRLTSMLRSGKEAYRSSHAIVTALKAGVESVGGDSDIVNIVEDTTHASAQVLMTADGLVDLLIPRGGKGSSARVWKMQAFPASRPARASAMCTSTGTLTSTWR